MKSFISVVILYFLVLFTVAVFAQPAEKKVVITGVRFAYPVVQKWIEVYNISNPDAKVVIESRTTTDPSSYDVLIEAFEQDNATRESRDYLYLGRYALIPFANAKSTFAHAYGEKGLTADLIKQIFFNDIYADKKKQKELEADFTIYTRLQKAGAPITFAKYFGYEQANIKGKAISGADEHLVKAVLKDSTGISYNVPGLLYDLKTRKPQAGLTIIPVDIDGNGKVSNDERFYDNLDTVIDKIEEGNLKNIPVEFLHLSIAKNSANPEALKFIQWVAANGQDVLAEFGFLKLDPKRFQEEKTKFNVAIN